MVDQPRQTELTRRSFLGKMAAGTAAAGGLGLISQQTTRAAAVTWAEDMRRAMESESWSVVAGADAVMHDSTAPAPCCVPRRQSRRSRRRLTVSRI